MDADIWASRRTAFGSEAAAYAFGRPSYPAEAFDWLLPHDGQTVLDLAAGTGRVTEALLQRGLEVVAVEPLAEMRSLIPVEAEVRDGTAEAIPAAAEAFDAVLVGQAFHWFDVDAAVREIARVLRPGGTVGLLWNLNDDRVDWVSRLCEVTRSEARATLIDADLDPPFAAPELFEGLERRVIEHQPEYDRRQLLAMVSSWSQVILMPEDERARVLDEVARLAPDGSFRLPLVCVCWRAVRSMR